MSLAWTAFSRTRCGSIPLPSSVISMMTLPPSWKACKSSRPSAGLPRFSRSSGGSMPWSMALRNRWVSGSRMASMIVLSSSVSWPSSSMRACFPQATARSRTTRGNLFQMLPIGCMRVFMTLTCSSVVSRLSRCTVPRNEASSWEVLNCMIWFRARTSSPTKVMSLSSRPTSTRMALSETAGARGSAGSAAAGPGCADATLTAVGGAGAAASAVGGAGAAANAGLPLALPTAAGARAAGSRPGGRAALGGSLPPDSPSTGETCSAPALTLGGSPSSAAEARLPVSFKRSSVWISSE